MRISDWSSDVCSSDLVGQPEGLADLFGRPPFLLHEPGEGLPLGNLVGIEPGDIIDQRSFQRGRIVDVLHDREGPRIGLSTLLCGDLRDMKATRSGDDLECLQAASLDIARKRYRPDPKRNKQAARATRGR